MVTSVSSGILVNAGHLLENLVFNALRRTRAEVFYYKMRTGREVDFVIPGRGRERALFQVCESLADPQTRKREISALSEAMAELRVATATIVTWNEQEQIRAAHGLIAVVPVWRFLLETPDTAAP